jgi:hypothetical protein
VVVTTASPAGNSATTIGVPMARDSTALIPCRCISSQVASSAETTARGSASAGLQAVQPATYVLREISVAKLEELRLVLERAADAIEMVIADGLAAAQNAFHGSSKDRA